ncbi:MAG TPA: VOC family protein [Polyangiaceae bacterium]|nr:VOC family protein [Polyangiaceae bacterium]
MPNPFAHVELSTDDLKKAKKFYSAVFAWKLNDLPAMPYTMIDVSGGVGGGLQKKQTPEQPTAWLPYVQVDDVKATMAKVLKAGGQAMLEYQDIGDMGSIGIFVDPQGATLGVWAVKAAAAPPPPAPAKKASAKAASAKASPAKAAPVKAAAPAKKVAAPAKKAAAPAKKAAKKAAPAAPTAAPAKKASNKSAPLPPVTPPSSKKAAQKKR